MIAPSGQRLLRRKKRVKILCGECFLKLEGTGTVGLAASEEQILAEMKTAIPNLWRKRN